MCAGNFFLEWIFCFRIEKSNVELRWSELELLTVISPGMESAEHLLALFFKPATQVQIFWLITRKVDELQHLYKQYGVA